jgi:urease gamma subunit
MLEEKDNLFESPYLADNARKETERSIKEKYQEEIKTINNLIKDMAAQGKTWACVGKDIIGEDGLKGGSLSWYYHLFGYKTMWFNEKKIIKISWR